MPKRAGRQVLVKVGDSSFALTKFCGSPKEIPSTDTSYRVQVICYQRLAERVVFSAERSIRTWDVLVTTFCQSDVTPDDPFPSSVTSPCRRNISPIFSQ
jgi:hypothetical protein